MVSFFNLCSMIGEGIYNLGWAGHLIIGMLFVTVLRRIYSKITKS